MAVYGFCMADYGALYDLHVRLTRGVISFPKAEFLSTKIN